jgi:hypothetical protein
MERKVMAKLFAKFDLDFIDNPKIVGLSDAAFRAYVEGIVYSRTHLTDGFIDSRIAGHRRWTDAAPELTSNDRNPSWVEVDGGWDIHDFGEHQTTNADIEVIRERKKSAANKRWDAVRDAETMQGALQPSIKRNAKGMPETETETETKTETEELKSVVPRKRGTRIPEPFMLTNEMRSWASSRVPGVDVNTATEKFVNYWRASTKNATKLDWTATWNNWLLSDFETRVQNRKPTPEERAFRTLGLATDVDMGEISE